MPKADWFKCFFQANWLRSLWIFVHCVHLLSELASLVQFRFHYILCCVQKAQQRCGKVFSSAPRQKFAPSPSTYCSATPTKRKATSAEGSFAFSTTLTSAILPWILPMLRCITSAIQRFGDTEFAPEVTTCSIQRPAIFRVNIGYFLSLSLSLLACLWIGGRCHSCTVLFTCLQI